MKRDAPAREVEGRPAARCSAPIERGDEIDPDRPVGRRAAPTIRVPLH